MKYIAKSAAKNISSLESQTMVPTATMFGRVAGPWPGMDGTGPACLTEAAVVATHGIMPTPEGV
ncbi:hypothetical protein GCM10012283_00700 [Phycicoccus endophyticus]|nr:hypothetical protein GCM10012283_00700 [Phycicoccus endophyticus]